MAKASKFANNHAVRVADLERGEVSTLELSGL